MQPPMHSHKEVAAQVPYVNKLLPKEKKSLVFFAGNTFLDARAEGNVRKAVHDALAGSSQAADVVFHTKVGAGDTHPHEGIPRSIHWVPSSVFLYPHTLPLLSP